LEQVLSRNPRDRQPQLQLQVRARQGNHGRAEPTQPWQQQLRQAVPPWSGASALLCGKLRTV